MQKSHYHNIGFIPSFVKIVKAGFSLFVWMILILNNVIYSYQALFPLAMTNYLQSYQVFPDDLSFILNFQVSLFFLFSFAIKSLQTLVTLDYLLVMGNILFSLLFLLPFVLALLFYTCLKQIFSCFNFLFSLTFNY